MKKFLFFVKSKVRHSFFGNKIIELLDGYILSDYLYKLLDFFYFTDAARRCKNPSMDTLRELKDSRLFFANNLERVEKICCHLADEQSKEVFKKAILFRQTLDIEDRPPFTIHDQYFAKDVVSLHHDEVFIDCGAYTGDTIGKFVKKCNKQYKRIIAFEPDEVNCIKIKAKKFKNIVVIDAGVWSKTQLMNFNIQNHTGEAKVDLVKKIDTGVDKRSVVIKSIVVRTIDDTETCSDCTYIKMDIEGSEMEALLGARNTIIKMRPKLAICIYHSDEDMLRIPEWILGLNLEYKLYIRHHFGERNETVAYAIP